MAWARLEPAWIGGLGVWCVGVVVGAAAPSLAPLLQAGASAALLGSVGARGARAVSGRAAASGAASVGLVALWQVVGVGSAGLWWAVAAGGAAGVAAIEALSSWRSGAPASPHGSSGDGQALAVGAAGLVGHAVELVAQLLELGAWGGLAALGGAATFAAGGRRAGPSWWVLALDGAARGLSARVGRAPWVIGGAAGVQVRVRGAPALVAAVAAQDAGVEVRGLWRGPVRVERPLERVVLDHGGAAAAPRAGIARHLAVLALGPTRWRVLAVSWSRWWALGLCAAWMGCGHVAVDVREDPSKGSALRIAASGVPCGHVAVAASGCAPTVDPRAGKVSLAVEGRVGDVLVPLVWGPRASGGASPVAVFLGTPAGRRRMPDHAVEVIPGPTVGTRQVTVLLVDASGGLYEASGTEPPAMVSIVSALASEAVVRAFFPPSGDTAVWVMAVDDRPRAPDGTPWTAAGPANAEAAYLQALDGLLEARRGWPRWLDALDVVLTDVIATDDFRAAAARAHGVVDIVLLTDASPIAEGATCRDLVAAVAPVAARIQTAAARGGTRPRVSVVATGPSARPFAPWSVASPTVDVTSLCGAAADAVLGPRADHAALARLAHAGGGGFLADPEPGELAAFLAAQAAAVQQRALVRVHVDHDGLRRAAGPTSLEITMPGSGVAPLRLRMSAPAGWPRPASAGDALVMAALATLAVAGLSLLGRAAETLRVALAVGRPRGR